MNLVSKINACAAADSQTMLRLYQQLLQENLSGHQSLWYAAYRGSYGRELWQTKLMKNWKVVDVGFPIGFDGDLAKEAKDYFAKARQSGGIDPQVMLSVESAGQSRVHLLKDAIAKDEWDKHWMKKWLARIGVGERMVGAFTLSPQSESYFLVDRPPDSPPFSESDREQFLTLLQDFPRLHYWLFLERGLVAPAKKPFSPRERDVLKQLMGPKTEAEIADALEISRGTTHNYILDIYKNLGVSSRYELLQLWLRSVS